MVVNTKSNSFRPIKTVLTPGERCVGWSHHYNPPSFWQRRARVFKFILIIKNIIDFSN